MKKFEEFLDIPGFRKEMVYPEVNADDEKLINIKIPTDAKTLINDIAKSRREIHKGQKSTTIYSSNYEEKGVLGELAFEILTGYVMDTSVRKRGDDYDFIINNYMIDVKASSKKLPRLYVKSKRLHNNYIYVLCHVNLRKLTAVFYGWATGKNVKKYGKFHRSKKFVSDLSIYLYHTQLKDMISLEKLLCINFKV
jgi:hypothetical protein